MAHTHTSAQESEKTEQKWRNGKNVYRAPKYHKMDLPNSTWASKYTPRGRSISYDEEKSRGGQAEEPAKPGIHGREIRRLHGLPCKFRRGSSRIARLRHFHDDTEYCTSAERERERSGENSRTEPPTEFTWSKRRCA